MAIRKTVAAVLMTGMVLSMIPLTSLAYIDERKPDYVKDTWKQSGGKWYYFDEIGAMVCNTSMEIKGKVYNFDKNGVCLNP